MATQGKKVDFRPKPVSRLRQQIELQIREAILTRSLGEGDKLPSEPELARMFSVSRSTVREALRSLDSAGLIEKIPGANGGSFVRVIDAEAFGRLTSDSMEMLILLGNASIGELATVRSLLEVPCCRMAALERTDEDVARLYEIVAEQKSAMVVDPHVPQMDVDFHSAIADATGNRVLSALVYALHNVTRPATRATLSEEVGRATVRQHLNLVRAIEARDPDAAEAAIQEHLHYLEEHRDDSRMRVPGPTTGH